MSLSFTSEMLECDTTGANHRQVRFGLTVMDETIVNQLIELVNPFTNNTR
ncbi:hypothetical protein ACFQNG_14400 [Laceyella putida]|uniref:Uncharacterized protein n=1 Tax=Laceyella putida TaxID=110101 RepID=A0ABW2RMW4_9BACL